MSAQSRIGAAENAISTAYTRESGRDATHQAAVELESRGLLSETRVQLEREVRAELAAEILAAITAHKKEFPGLYLVRGGMYDALRIVRGADGAVDAVTRRAPLVCHVCGFIAPVLWDEPDGKRRCVDCKAAVSDSVSRCHLCGYASVSLDGTGDGRWVCQGGCAPDLTAIDLTGGAE